MKGLKPHEITSFWWHCTLNSYAIIFFSANIWFGFLLMCASFCNPTAGLAGLIGGIIANIFSQIYGLNRDYILKGYYGYDAILTCVALATFYEWNSALLLMIICASLLSVLISIACTGIFIKYNLPALSLPFVFTAWIVLSSAQIVPGMQYDLRNLFWMNEAYKTGGAEFLDWYYRIENIDIALWIKVYLKSLSSLFFQNNLVCGILISFGLLIYSRIAFSLSLVGFLSAYFCYGLVSANTSDFYYNFTGLNFIFMAIAIGGFFIVPSFASYLTVIILTPVLLIVVFGMNKLMNVLGIPAYSMPFSITVTLFLYLLNQRTVVKYLHLVKFQNYSPEKNLISFLNGNKWASKPLYWHINLPFWGEWIVSQAHNGEHTHKGPWSKAFDFIVLDDEMKSYTMPGTQIDDYYCYNKPVLACADGYVVNLLDKIEDNGVADVNTQNNWGNTVVMYHIDGLYSQLSHLKMDTLKVKIGDYIKKGEILGYCGNSGRSPEPHIHFQLQETPAIGAPTLDFPLAYYLLRKGKNYELKTYSKPNTGDFVTSIHAHPLLQKAFHLIPGQKISWQYSNELHEVSILHWQIITNYYNQSYIYCETTGATAYFINDGTMFYFTSYFGARKGALFLFYLACNKVLLGYYKNLFINEYLPVGTFDHKIVSFVQDFVLPFFQPSKAIYESEFLIIDDEHFAKNISFGGNVKLNVANFIISKQNFEVKIGELGIKEILFNSKKGNSKLTCVS